MNTPSKVSRWLRNGKWHPGPRQLPRGVCSRCTDHNMIVAPIWRRVWPVTIHLALVYKRVCLVDRVRRLVYIASLSSTFSCRSLPQSRVFLMSSPGSPALQQLYHLDRSSSDFHDRLCNVFYGSEYSQCVPNLEGDDLVWLVDYLDKVCRRVTFPFSASTSLDSR